MGEFKFSDRGNLDPPILEWHVTNTDEATIEILGRLRVKFHSIHENCWDTGAQLNPQSNMPPRKNAHSLITVREHCDQREGVSGFPPTLLLTVEMVVGCSVFSSRIQKQTTSFLGARIYEEAGKSGLQSSSEVKITV